LGCQHTLFLLLHQLFFQIVETYSHCIMGYLRDTAEPCANQWPKLARMISKTLFDASHPLLLSVLLLYRAVTWTYTSPLLVVSVCSPLMQTVRHAFLQPGLHPATSSSYMPVTALSSASISEL